MNWLQWSEMNIEGNTNVRSKVGIMKGHLQTWERILRKMLSLKMEGEEIGNIDLFAFKAM